VNIVSPKKYHYLLAIVTSKNIDFIQYTTKAFYSTAIGKAIDIFQHQITAIHYQRNIAKSSHSSA
jgi:hypothetical protein